MQAGGTVVTAIDSCPAGLTMCTAGLPVMLGTYAVQLSPGAVTVLSLRRRRSWQP